MPAQVVNLQANRMLTPVVNLRTNQMLAQVATLRDNPMLARVLTLRDNQMLAQVVNLQASRMLAQVVNLRISRMLNPVVNPQDCQPNDLRGNLPLNPVFDLVDILRVDRQDSRFHFLHPNLHGIQPANPQPYPAPNRMLCLQVNPVVNPQDCQPNDLRGNLPLNPVLDLVDILHVDRQDSRFHFLHPSLHGIQQVNPQPYPAPNRMLCLQVNPVVNPQDSQPNDLRGNLPLNPVFDLVDILRVDRQDNRFHFLHPSLHGIHQGNRA